MANPTIQEEVNLQQYPAIDPRYKADQGAQLTIGDLHANALKLIYFLIRHGVMELRGDNRQALKEEERKHLYQKIVAIYNKDTTELTTTDVTDFDAIIKNAKIHSGATIRLIGDELADRGSNDYFVLKLLERLGQANVPVDILLSNHGIEFLGVYEGEFKTFTSQIPWNGQTKSLACLGVLINKMPTLRQQIEEIVQQYYQPNLNLVSYTLDATANPPKMTLYTHAPVGLETVQGLAEKLKVVYHDSSMQALATTLDNINRAFYEQVVKPKKTYKTAFPEGRPSNKIDMSMYERVMWNRVYSEAQTPAQHKGYQLHFVHGHDTSTKTHGHSLENITNLDNQLGKGSSKTTGIYTIHYCHETPGLIKKALSSAETELSRSTPSDDKAIDLVQPHQQQVQSPEFQTGNNISTKVTNQQVSDATSEAITSIQSAQGGSPLVISTQPRTPTIAQHSLPQPPQQSYLSNKVKAAANFIAAGKTWCEEKKKTGPNFAYDYLAQTNTIVYIDQHTQRRMKLLTLSEKSIIFAHKNPADFEKALDASMGILEATRVLNIKIEGGTKQQREAVLQNILDSHSHQRFNITVAGHDKPLQTRQDIAAYLNLPLQPVSSGPRF